MKTYAFDTNGTLVYQGTPNEGLMNLLKTLHSAGNRIFVWSAGGKQVAEHIVKEYNLGDYVHACYTKGECDEEVDIAFDDQEQQGREKPIAKYYLYVNK